MSADDRTQLIARVQDWKAELLTLKGAVAEASDYFLTEKQLRDRFEERVKDFVFSGYAPQDQPVLVLLGGQPAAGKSQAMAASEQRHANQHLVPLTGDELRPFHPQHQKILDNEPWLFPEATGQASGAWVRMSIEYARDYGYSLMLEGDFRDPAMTLATAEEFAGLGRRVEVVGLGVRAERSRLDSLCRFLEGGRWTLPDRHDLAYRMMPETIAAAEASPAVHRITVTDRSGADLYVNDRSPDSRWISKPAAVNALHASRARQLPPDEAACWLGLHQQVVTELAVRGQVDATSIPVLQQVAVDAETVAAMDPNSQSPARLAHTAARPLLQVLACEPIAPGAPLPLLLTPDSVLAPRGERIALAATEPTPDVSGPRVDLVQRLIEQGAPAELIDRARTAAREDQEYAQDMARRPGAEIAQRWEEGRRTSAELERRQRLPLAMRQAEDAVRQRLHDRLQRSSPSQIPPQPEAPRPRRWVDRRHGCP
ncbi:zeta toxin family protein [Streptomyces sp. NPDC052042]|uniref:zeta toxin family protein n=1 Tax=Streptomyces sp. NPDC052042 TaxID=3365683 RepID=UPI0037D3D4B3